MSFKCGIVGMPNVGKSTLFNALTNSSKAQAANFPFWILFSSTLHTNILGFKDNSPLWLICFFSNWDLKLEISLSLFIQSRLVSRIFN